MLGDTVHTSVISFTKSGRPETSSQRRVVIMDEVDGMSSGDRGGNAQLMSIIKTSATPIICICNDREKQSVRSLAKHCFDLKFTLPTAPQIADRMMQVRQPSPTMFIQQLTPLLGSTDCPQ